MAKYPGLIIFGFIFALLLSGSSVSSGKLDKLPHRLKGLFHTYYSNFELLRVFGSSFYRYSLKGFSLKFQEYARENYDSGLLVLDLATKLDIVFDFKNITLSKHISSVYAGSKSNLLEELGKVIGIDWQKHRPASSNTLPIIKICEKIRKSCDTTICDKLKNKCNKPTELKNASQHLKQLCEKIRKHTELNTGTQIQQLCETIRKLDKTEIGKIESIKNQITTMSNLTDSLHNFYKSGSPISSYQVVCFLLDLQQNLLKSKIDLLIETKKVYVVYKMKKVFLTRLVSDIKEFSDIKQTLSSEDPLIEFLMDRALRRSKPNYPKCYTY